jgi:hypothetical protein
LCKSARPLGQAAAFFQQKTHAGLFDPQPDPNPHWVQSFFRSMADGGGALIIGGGRSALIAGHLALSLHIPLLPVACFGGAARRVWETIQPNDDLPTKEERNLMGRPDWQPKYATELVDALLAQDRRREQRARQTRHQRTARWAFALVMLLLGIAMLVAGSTAAGPPWAAIAMLYLLGPVGGCAAALIRSIYFEEEPFCSVPETITLGFFAGLASSLLYVIAHVSVSGQLEVKWIALAIAFATGLAAGAAYDKVLPNWLSGRIKLSGSEASEASANQ